MADRSPEGVANDLPEALPLAELMMTCLSLGEEMFSCYVRLANPCFVAKTLVVDARRHGSCQLM